MKSNIKCINEITSYENTIKSKCIDKVENNCIEWVVCDR